MLHSAHPIHFPRSSPPSLPPVAKFQEISTAYQRMIRDGDESDEDDDDDDDDSDYKVDPTELFEHLFREMGLNPGVFFNRGGFNFRGRGGGGMPWMPPRTAKKGFQPRPKKKAPEAKGHDSDNDFEWDENTQDRGEEAEQKMGKGEGGDLDHDDDDNDYEDSEDDEDDDEEDEEDEDGEDDEDEDDEDGEYGEEDDEEEDECPAREENKKKAAVPAVPVSVPVSTKEAAFEEDRLPALPSKHKGKR
jgi:hypothetical protein